VQISGVPGAGKTTISRALAPHVGAVVLDHDVSKSALLGADVPVALAGRASYEVLLALAAQLLRQGFSVIFDSPC
jgi:predicted kinase